MRYPAPEKLEIIRLVEQSHLCLRLVGELAFLGKRGLGDFGALEKLAQPDIALRDLLLGQHRALFLCGEPGFQFFAEVALLAQFAGHFRDLGFQRLSNFAQRGNVSFQPGQVAQLNLEGFLVGDDLLTQALELLGVSCTHLLQCILGVGKPRDQRIPF